MYFMIEAQIKVSEIVRYRKKEKKYTYSGHPIYIQKKMPMPK